MNTDHTRNYNTSKIFTNSDVGFIKQNAYTMGLEVLDGDPNCIKLAGEPDALKRFGYYWNVVSEEYVCSWTKKFGIIRQFRGYMKDPLMDNTLSGLSLLNIEYSIISGNTVEIRTSPRGIKIAGRHLLLCLNRVRDKSAFVPISEEEFMSKAPVVTSKEKPSLVWECLELSGRVVEEVPIEVNKGYLCILEKMSSKHGVYKFCAVFEDISTCVDVMMLNTPMRAEGGFYLTYRVGSGGGHYRINLMKVNTYKLLDCELKCD